MLIVAAAAYTTAAKRPSTTASHRFFIGKNRKSKVCREALRRRRGHRRENTQPRDRSHHGGLFCEMEMIQLAGVDSTLRETEAALDANAKIVIAERLLTHGNQKARSNMTVNLNGKIRAQIVSRSVARDHSEQVFYPRAVGNTSAAPMSSATR